MVFSTQIFLLLFLPLFLAGYYALPFRARSAWILLGSWIFYGWWRIDFLGLLAAATVWTYLLGRIAARGGETAGRSRKPNPARIAVIAGIILNLGCLAYFKYFNFAIDSVNAVLSLAGTRPISAWQVILPIGISFYVFQATSYLVDVYRGDVPAASRYVDLAAYIALFPQLIAGPILRYKDLAAQLETRSHSLGKFSEGAYRFMIGFCKKVIIADTVALIADTSFALEQPGLIGGWLGTLSYTVQLYFDFSGYSDMAIGLGLMMGFRFIENFRHPYISRSITEFWRRWHISLSTWLRDYLYIPLGGNRRGRRRTYLNILIVMLLGGLWHGAAWTFVVWGAWHGMLLALERRFSVLQKRWQQFAVVAVPTTSLLVILGWVVFRAPDLSAAQRMYAGMFGGQGLGQTAMLQAQIGLLSPFMLVIGLLLMYLAPFLHADAYRRDPAAAAAADPTAAANPAADPAAADPAAADPAAAADTPPRVAQPPAAPGSLPAWLTHARLLLIPLFLMAVLKLAAESFSPFLYFQF